MPWEKAVIGQWGWEELMEDNWGKAKHMLLLAFFFCVAVFVEERNDQPLCSATADAHACEFEYPAAAQKSLGAAVANL